MCEYCEVVPGGKRKKLFKKSQKMGSKGKLKSEAIIKKVRNSKKYSIVVSSWTGAYVHHLGNIPCNYCPVCGRNMVNPVECEHEYGKTEYEILVTVGSLITHKTCTKCGKKDSKLLS